MKSEIQIQATKPSIWKKSGIYKITSPTGRIYIGLSKNLGSRKAAYGRLDCKGQPKIFNSISKHGWDAHLFEVVTFCTHEELNDLEIYYVKHYNSFKAGLNSKEGGHFAKLSAESRKKVGDAHRGMKHTDAVKQRLRDINLGKKHTAETCAKVSAAHMGNKYSLGFKHSEETRAKMTIAKSGIVFSEERKDKIRKRLMGNKNGKNATAKKVINIDTNVIYISATFAAEKYGYVRQTLTNMLTGFRKNTSRLRYA